MLGNRRAFLAGVLTVVAALVVVAFVRFLADGFVRTGGAGGNESEVERVVDGDTLVLEDGATVRVIGMDAPETHHPDMTGPQPFGLEAARRAEELVLGRRVRLEADVEGRDAYGRRLAHVWMDDELMSEVMIAQGLASVLLVPPNGRYADRLRAAEDAARANGVGMWSGLPTPLPVFANARSGEGRGGVASRAGAEHGELEGVAGIAALPPDRSAGEGAEARGTEGARSSVDGSGISRSPAHGSVGTTSPASESGAGSSVPCGERAEGSMTAAEAETSIGEHAAVEFRVAGTHDTGKVTFLNSHDPYQDHFYVAVFPDDYAAFPEPPVEYFDGRCVVVQGKVELYRGTPQIVLKTPADIVVVGD